MLSVSSLIDFLLMLLRDEDAQAEFTRDPQGMLARHNLDGVTAQDICEAEPMLADRHGITRRDDDGNHGGRHRNQDDDHDRGHGGGHHGGSHDDDDPVRVINHVTHSYEVDREVVYQNTSHDTYNEYNSYTQVNDHSVTAGDGATVIQDSFNQDNDGVDNKGGVIDDSNVAGGNQDTVGNSQDNDTTTTTTTVSDNDTVNDNDTSSTTTTSSDDDTINDNDVVTHQDTDVNTSIDDSVVNGSYAADGPLTALDAVDNGGALADTAP